MALTIDQMTAASYPAVLAKQKTAENQWADTSVFKFLESMGVLKRTDFGPTIEIPLDYRRNPDGGVLVTDQDASALLKTEVLTAASYAVGQVSYAVTWTKGDDAKNPTPNQKVDFVKALLTNGIDTHDDLMEQLIFTTSTAGGDEVIGLDTLVPDSGQGTVGGIDASAETWWRNFADTYTDETDIIATFVEAHDTAMKGSGSNMGPTAMVSGQEAHALYESALQPQMRYSSNDKGDGGFIKLMFKNSKYAFSQYGDDHVYFLNPKNFEIRVSKEYFRDKGSTEVVPGQNAFYFLIYSALQMVTNNKSRLAVVSQA